MLFGAAGEDGRDAGDAEFRGFFKGPLEVIELEDGEVEVERERGVGLEFFMQDEVDAFGRYTGDLCAVKEAGGDDVKDLANFSAEDACQMRGLIACECCGGGVAGFRQVEVGDPAASCHGSEV